MAMRDFIMTTTATRFAGHESIVPPITHWLIDSPRCGNQAKCGKNSEVFELAPKGTNNSSLLCGFSPPVLPLAAGGPQVYSAGWGHLFMRKVESVEYEARHG